MMFFSIAVMSLKAFFRECFKIYGITNTDIISVKGHPNSFTCFKSYYNFTRLKMMVVVENLATFISLLLIWITFSVAKEQLRLQVHIIVIKVNLVASAVTQTF